MKISNARMLCIFVLSFCLAMATMPRTEAQTVYVMLVIMDDAPVIGESMYIIKTRLRQNPGI